MSGWKGMIFGAESVRGIIDGRKRQTRRVVKASNSTVLGSRVRASSPAWAGLRFDEARVRTRSTLMMAVAGAAAPHDLHLDVPWDHPEDRARGLDSGCIYRVRPDLEPGDVVYVKEVVALQHMVDGEPPEFSDGRPTLWTEHPDAERYWTQAHYRATDPPPDLCCESERCRDCERVGYGPHWKSPLHMPRWAARLWLEIEEVRVERLAEISADDCVAEGIDPSQIPGIGSDGALIAAYREAWERINGKRAPWSSSPWVWVYTFRPCERPAGAQGEG